MSLVGTAETGERCFDKPVLTGVAGGAPSEPANVIRQVLSRPDYELDFLRTKLSIDCAIEPSTHIEMVVGKIDRFVKQARIIAGCNASETARLGAVRKLLLDAGPWNEDQPLRV
ncbi:MAG TPA: hypothetical protein VF628_01670 [Allosphingosinicella sp.]|jgi:hypothetical protein